MPCSGMKSWVVPGTGAAFVVAMGVLSSGRDREAVGREFVSGGQGRGPGRVGAREDLVHGAGVAADRRVAAPLVEAVQLVLHRDQPAGVGDEVGRVENA